MTDQANESEKLDRSTFLLVLSRIRLALRRRENPFFHPLLQAGPRRLSRRALGFLGSYGASQWDLSLPQLGQEARRTRQFNLDAAFHRRAVAEVHSGVC